MPGRLFTPLRVGRMELSTRVVMAPLTRSRAPGGIPNEMMARYYAQRANPKTGASLISNRNAVHSSHAEVVCQRRISASGADNHIGYASLQHQNRQLQSVPLVAIHI